MNTYRVQWATTIAAANPQEAVDLALVQVSNPHEEKVAFLTRLWDAGNLGVPKITVANRKRAAARVKAIHAAQDGEVSTHD